jgi:hypothetical protein
MINYYYEFPEGSRVFDQPTRYALMRGYHPEEASAGQQLFHSQCYVNAQRIWLENANGCYLVREQGRDVHRPIQPKEMTWVKLQAREIEIL